MNQWKSVVTALMRLPATKSIFTLSPVLWGAFEPCTMIYRDSITQQQAAHVYLIICGHIYGV